MNTDLRKDKSLLSTPVSSRFHKALKYASKIHAEQSRKHTEIPYVSHLMAVSGIVMEAGGTETEAIAALLHDAAEDQGGRCRLFDIRERFGVDVAEIVEHCSDTFEDPKPAWAERKAAYTARLKDADASTKLVSIADKLHNARATLRDLKLATHPRDVWGRFSATREQTIGNYESLLVAYRVGAPDHRRTPLEDDLESTIAEMKTRA